MLHLADDRAEVRQVTAEDVELVHPPQLVQDTALGLEQLDETGAVLRVGAEIVIDQRARAPQGADRSRRHSLQLRVALHRQEGFEDRAVVGVEDVLVDDVEKLVGVLEARVDRHRRRLGRGEDHRADVLHQDRVELGDRFRRAVILLHQLLARAARRRRGEAHLLGDCRLVGRTAGGPRAGRRAGASGCAGVAGSARGGRGRRPRRASRSRCARGRASCCRSRSPARSRVSSAGRAGRRGSP